MRNDSSGNDPRTIWQNQPTEPSIMTMEKIREKIQEVRAKTRKAMLGWIITPLLVAGMCGWGIAQVHGGPLVRAVFAFAIAWSLAGQYFLKRGVWSATLPRDAALSTGLESYRRGGERRRYNFCYLFLLVPSPVGLSPPPPPRFRNK